MHSVLASTVVMIAVFWADVVASASEALPTDQEIVGRNARVYEPPYAYYPPAYAPGWAPPPTAYEYYPGYYATPWCEGYVKPYFATPWFDACSRAYYATAWF